MNQKTLTELFDGWPRTDLDPILINRVITDEAARIGAHWLSRIWLVYGADNQSLYKVDREPGGWCPQ